MSHHVAVLPGDGIGPEVAAEAVRVLDALGVEHSAHSFGGNAIQSVGTPLPEETLLAAKEADAVLLGAVGLPELEGREVRPEQGLLALRRELGVYANLRPARGDGIDLIVVRELTGASTSAPRGRATTARGSTRASTPNRRWRGSPGVASRSRASAGAA